MNNIPNKDGEFNDWQENLVDIVTTNATPWGIPPTAIANLTTSQGAWEEAWDAAKTKPSRTPLDVSEKDAARVAYELVLRPFIQQYIMVNPATSDTQREAMQIKPRATHHVAIPVPAVVPIVSIVPDTGHRVKVCFKQQTDQPGEFKRAKPEGVKFCNFVYSVDTPIADPKHCLNRVSATRTETLVEFDASLAGKTVYLYGQFANPRNEGGPYTDVITFRIP